MHASWRKIGTLLVFAFYQVKLVSSDCVMRGVCGSGKYGPEICFYNGTGISLGEDAEYALNSFCPYFTDVEKGQVCCSHEQIESLAFKFQLSAALGLENCPSCPVNFEKLWCMMTCSPRQSDFLKIDRVYRNDDDSVVIEKLTYFISQSFAEVLFASCKDIKGLANGFTFLDIACGDSSPEECNVERMLEFLGSTPENDGYSNIEISFDILPDRAHSYYLEDTEHFILPMNEKAFRCSEKPFESVSVCSCEDCADNCATTSDISYDYESYERVQYWNITDSVDEDTPSTTVVPSTKYIVEEERLKPPLKTINRPKSDANRTYFYLNNIAFYLSVVCYCIISL